MKCPFCRGEVPLPPKIGEDTTCRSCSREFKLLGDWGWWSYTAEVYIPKESKRGGHPLIAWIKRKLGLDRKGDSQRESDSFYGQPVTKFNEDKHCPSCNTCINVGVVKLGQKRAMDGRDVGVCYACGAILCFDVRKGSLELISSEHWDSLPLGVKNAVLAISSKQTKVERVMSDPLFGEGEENE